MKFDREPFEYRNREREETARRLTLEEERLLLRDLWRPHEKTDDFSSEARFWGLGSAGYALLTGILLSTLPALLSRHTGNMLGLELMAYMLQIGCFVLIPLRMADRLHLPLSALGLVPCRARRLLLGAGAGVLLYAVNFLLSQLMILILPGSIQAEQAVVTLLELAQGPGEKMMLGLFVLVLGPIGEEFLFRGFMLPPLERFPGRSKGILLCGAIFGLVHANLVTFLPLAVGGCGFAWLYDRHHDISVCILAHIVWNTIALILYYSIGVA